MKTIFIVLSVFSFGLSATTIKDGQAADKPGHAAATSATTAHHAPAKTTAPETALKWLMNGNARFIKHSSLRKDGQTPSDIKRLSTGQSPHTIVLSCSDSRVPPELAFDQKLGEIFVVRTAGHAIDDNAIGSMEYAVEHLGSRLVVVMGHSSCGAVKAAHSTLGGKSAGSPSLDSLLGKIQPHIVQLDTKNPSAEFISEGWANTEGVARQLVAKSTILGGAWKKGDLWVVPAQYDLKTGKVAFRDNLKKDMDQRTPADNKKAELSH